MIYEFRDADGNTIELDLSPSEAPDIGAERVVQGRTFKRVASVPQIAGAYEGSTKFPRFESSQLPKWWAHHRGEFSPSGKPRYTSRQQVEEDMARARQAGTEIEYGEL